MFYGIKKMRKPNYIWLILITITALFFFNFPFIKTIDNNLIFGFIPLNYFYFYFVWLIIIVTLGTIINKVDK